MRPHLLLATASVFVVAAGAALAHHGWGSYDAARKFTITAPVEHVEWQNPHVHIALKYDGAVWMAVLAPLFRMEARGLSEAMLKPGTQVTAVGYPSTRVEHEMRAAASQLNFERAAELRDKIKILKERQLSLA